MYNRIVYVLYGLVEPNKTVSEDRLTLILNQLHRISTHCDSLSEENRELRRLKSEWEKEQRVLIEKCRAADEQLSQLITKLKSLGPDAENFS